MTKVHMDISGQYFIYIYVREQNPAINLVDKTVALEWAFGGVKNERYSIRELSQLTYVFTLNIANRTN